MSTAMQIRQARRTPEKVLVARWLQSQSSYVGHRFGQRLRALREEKGWTQGELAIHLKLNRGFVSEMERGSKTPTLSCMETIARGLEITLSDLVDGI